jgi:hypothetical protein
VFQYSASSPCATSLKSVPPTATSYCVDAAPFTAIPLVAAVSKFWSAYAAPESPAATNTDTPFVTAV